MHIEMELPSDALWQAFQDGHQFATNRGSTEMRCREAGSLVLPTGRLVICDPQFDLVQDPFSFRVEPGEYPVFFSLIGEFEIALQMVLFGDRQPTQWTRTKPGHFSVDSATAAIMDAKLARMLVRAAEKGSFDRHWQRVMNEMEENNGLWANVCLHEKTGANLVAFRTMGGDGSFHSYLGHLPDGTLVCLVTDFFLAEQAT